MDNTQQRMLETFTVILNNHISGKPITEFRNHLGYIQIMENEVIGGEIGFKDGNSKIDIYIKNGELSIFRPSTQLYHSKGYATHKALRTYSVPYTKDKIEGILNKSCDEPYVKDFLELAKKIFAEHENEFNYKGEFIDD